MVNGMMKHTIFDMDNTIKIGLKRTITYLYYDLDYTFYKNSPVYANNGTFDHINLTSGKPITTLY